MRKSKTYLVWTIILSLLTVAINVFIIAHSCLNASESTNASKGIVDISENIINTISPGAINASNYDSFATFIRKLFGHFGLFFISGVLTSLDIYLLFHSKKWSKYWLLITISLSFGLLMGIITETIQLTIPGRSGEFTDVLIDFGGYVLGFSIVLLILFVIIRKRSK